MRNTLYASWLLFLLLFCLNTLEASHPQIRKDQILFKAGPVKTNQDFNREGVLSVPENEIIEGRYYRVLHFNSTPSAEVKSKLDSAGIRLLNYIPYNAFLTSIQSEADLSVLESCDIRSMLILNPVQKSSRSIRENSIPEHAIPYPGAVDLIVQYFSDLSIQTVLREFGSRNYEVLKIFPERNQVRLRIAEDQIQSLLALPLVKFVEELEAPSIPDDTKGRSLHRSNMINSEYATGLDYDGSGVSISLADDGEVGPHIDFTGRITQLISTGPGGSHGDMTAGIAVGAGNLNPAMAGMADGAHIYIHDVDDGNNPYDHIYNATYYYTTYGAVITSTSYSQGCNNYNTISSTGDQIVHQNPHFNFVFSAGNRGQNDCGYGTNAAWGTITGGFKQGKNVIACGNLDAYDVLDPTSSRGPAEDGRVKPDICANGRDQNSTRDDNRYQVGGGTSAACPGIAGISAQLIQAWREMNPGEEAPSPLIKAAMLNTAWDLGNAGPDFTYGWGRVNAFRALNLLQEERYLLDSVSNGIARQHVISVPSGVKQLKCMLYWLDVEGDPLSAVALVNDLDMTLEDPAASVYQPWILDPSPVVASLTSPAIRGADHLNNMEQVTLENPQAGNYTIEVNGTLIPSGTQKYYILWELLSEEVTLTYPNGGEGFVPGEVEALRWDAYGNSGTFDLEYSLDNGSAWQSMVTGVPAGNRQFDWIIPNTVSDQVLVRITRGSFTDESNSLLAIMNLPADLNIDFACASVMQLSWSAAAGAAAYEVSQLGSMYMDSIGTTSATFLQIPVSDTLETWFSVKAIGTNGGEGRRAVAVKKTPGSLNCTFADDLNLVNVQNPTEGLLFPCQSLSAVPIVLAVRNDGLNIAHNFTLSYSINGGLSVVETYTDTLPQGGNLAYTFATPADLSTQGNYQISIFITYPADANTLNNGKIHIVDVFNTATVPVVEDFESAAFPPPGWQIEASGATQEWQQKTGITGADGNMTTAAWFDNYSYNNNGARDYLTTFLADLTGISNPQLSFDVAYANYSGSSDALAVEISTDCGLSFMPTSYLKAGAILASAGSSTSDWEPTQVGHWRRDSLSLAGHANTQVMIRFVNINDFGNNLYVDNINLEAITMPGISKTVKPALLSLAPNPSSGLFSLNVWNLES